MQNVDQEGMIWRHASLRQASTPPNTQLSLYPFILLIMGTLSRWLCPSYPHEISLWTIEMNGEGFDRDSLPLIMIFPIKTLLQQLFPSHHHNSFEAMKLWNRQTFSFWWCLDLGGHHRGKALTVFFRLGDVERPKGVLATFQCSPQSPIPFERLILLGRKRNC